MRALSLSICMSIYLYHTLCLSLSLSLALPCKLGGSDIHEYSRIFMDNGYFRIYFFTFVDIRGYS